MNFMFEWQEQYLTSEHSERVKYCSCHENIKFISSSLSVKFFSLYKQTDDGVFDDFPKISDHFPKIFQNSSVGQRNVPEHFPRLSENSRRCPKTIEEDPKMFRWYTNYFKYNLRDKHDISEIIDIFTCEDIVSFLSICYHSVYHWLLYNKYMLLAVWEVRIGKTCDRGLDFQARGHSFSLYGPTLRRPIIFLSFFFLL